MDRGIGSDLVLRKAAQQVCGALAGSSPDALLWIEVQFKCVSVPVCVWSVFRMPMVGFITAGHVPSVRSFKEAHITHRPVPLSLCSDVTAAVKVAESPHLRPSFCSL